MAADPLPPEIREILRDVAHGVHGPDLCGRAAAAIVRRDLCPRCANTGHELLDTPGTLAWGTCHGCACPPPGAAPAAETPPPRECAKHGTWDVGAWDAFCPTCMVEERSRERAALAALRQAHWDGRAIGGFDNDGDPTPKAVASDFAALILSDWRQARADLDEARAESDAAEAALAALRAALAEIDILRVLVANMSRCIGDVLALPDDRPLPLGLRSALCSMQDHAEAARIRAGLVGERREVAGEGTARATASTPSLPAPPTSPAEPREAPPPGPLRRLIAASRDLLPGCPWNNCARCKEWWDAIDGAEHVEHLLPAAEDVTYWKERHAIEVGELAEARAALAALREALEGLATAWEQRKDRPEPWGSGWNEAATVHAQAVRAVLAGKEGSPRGR